MSSRRKFLPTLTLAIALACCLGYYLVGLLQTRYACRVSGDTLRYRQGIKFEEYSRQDGPFQFDLMTSSTGGTFIIKGLEKFPEYQNKEIRYDRKRSDDVNAYYVYDVTDSSTRVREVTSLGLNKTSGDINLFHHRWLPPSGWEDSDLYSLSGSCARQD